MAERILMVDDDARVLEGYRRILHHEFSMETAKGGEQALRMVANGEYAVVVSDMRMPVMDGLQVLSRIKLLAPDTVRIMLTGNGEIETAIDAVNQGNVFRFLTKPCSKDLMARTLTAALMQYRLITAEKELLEQTLSGCIQVLTEVLSLVNPAAFGRAVRARRYIHHIATSMALENVWRYEMAAMMSQLGCVTLYPEVVEAVYTGRELSPEDQIRYDSHPAVARDLLSKIPRMEPIAWMIGHQRDAQAAENGSGDPAVAVTMVLGAQILKAALIFDELVFKGMGQAAAVEELKVRCPDSDPRIAQSLLNLELNVDPTAIRTCRIDELYTGMIVQNDVRTTAGVLVVEKGVEVTFPVMLKLKNFHARKAIENGISVLPPRASFATSAS